MQSKQKGFNNNFSKMKYTFDKIKMIKVEGTSLAIFEI
jgi:hypothetical protein